MGPAGVQEPLSDVEVARVVAAVQALAPESVAVALLFAFRHPEHERRLAAALRGALADVPVAASHEVLPVFREFERFSTTTVEAYLRPKVSSYLARLEREARSRIGTLRIMTSTGGTLAPPAAARRAAALALSGPAGGVVGAQLVGAAVGLSELLTLDMGGTSADASLVTGGTAVPNGPGAGGGLPLAPPPVLTQTATRGGGPHPPPPQGGRPKGGPAPAGRGPLFGCALADGVGMRTIVVPPHPGVLSALGLAAAAERVDVLASYHRELDGLQPTDIGRAFSPLLRNGSEQLPGAALWRYVDCRFAGQGYELTIPVATNNPRQIRDAFLAAHRERLGHEGVGQAVELVNLRVVAVREAPLPQLAGNAGTKRSTAKSRGRRAVVLGRGTKRVTAALWPLDELAAGVTLDGPAILAGRDATALIESGWRGTVHQSGAILVERV